MKTNLPELLKTVTAWNQALTTDRKELTLPKDADDTAIAEHNRIASLLGHTISGLHGIEANVRGLIGEEVEPVTRQKPKVQTPATEPAPAKP